MRTSTFILILVLFVLTMGCTGNQDVDTVHQMPSKPTIENSAQINKSPDSIIQLFTQRYNNRDISGLLEIFSDGIRNEHPINDFKKELEFAEDYSVKIVDWSVSNVTSNNENSGKDVNVSLKVEWNGREGNLTFRLPLKCQKYACYIDGWIFEFLHRYVKTEYCLSLNLSSNISKGCWKIIAEKAMQIAMNDSKVRMIMGPNSKIMNVTMLSMETIEGYKVYPVIVVDQKESTDYIFVDVKKEKVVNIGTIYKLPPPPNFSLNVTN